MAGVSVQDLGGRRYRLRWREWVEQGGERKRADKSIVVHSREAAIEMQAKVLRAIETQGWFEVEAKPEVLVGDLEAAGRAWLRQKAARGCSDGTIKRYGTSLGQWFKFLHQRAGGTVPVTVLTRDLFADAILAWRADKLSDSTIYNNARVAVELWDWAFDDPAAFPGVPTPPRDKKALLPKAAVYAPPEPPTMAELDACLRVLDSRSYTAKGAAVVMRFTGLRASQVMALRCKDVNLARRELRVTTGKSRREQAEQRVVPISTHLVAELSAWVGSQDGEAPLVRRRRTGRAWGINLPMDTLSMAWEKVTLAGEARREVWEPPNRDQARPEHAFRAGFQAFLDGQGVRDSVIDFLVGHSPKSVRGRHYAPPTMEQLRLAVELLPPIAWAVEAQGDNVVEFKRP